MNKVQVCVIGCGYWGKNLVRNFAQLGVLAAVCDENEVLAEKASLEYGIPQLSLEDVLKSDIKAVIIATPAVQHFGLTKRALEAEKHVFVEKPLALDVKEAQELCALAARVDRTLMVGHLLQYHPAFLALKELVSKGTLGKLQYIYSNRLNLGKFRNEENILWSFAPHDISMILGLVGELPETVYATGACHLNQQIQDVTTTHMTFRNDIQAHIFVSWLHPYKEQKLVVVGDGGMSVFDDSLPWKEKLKIYPHKVTWIDGVPQAQKADSIEVILEVVEPLKLECEHFLECIEKSVRPRTDGFEGLRVLQVLDASQKSLRSHATIELKKGLLPYFVHDTSFVDDGCQIGRGTKIWHFSHILKGTIIGENCIIGQNVMIGPDVIVGNNCKIQNNVSLYKGLVLDDGVFCGPSCVFTNVHTPRAEIERKKEFRPTHIERGVTIGANATIVAGNRLGAYSLIGAGAVVTKDVEPHALIVGNPGKQIGWVSHAGEKLGDNLICPREDRRYEIRESQLFEVY